MVNSTESNMKTAISKYIEHPTSAVVAHALADQEMQLTSLLRSGSILGPQAETGVPVLFAGTLVSPEARCGIGHVKLQDALEKLAGVVGKPLDWAVFEELVSYGQYARLAAYGMAQKEVSFAGSALVARLANAPRALIHPDELGFRSTRGFWPRPRPHHAREDVAMARFTLVVPGRGCPGFDNALVGPHFIIAYQIRYSDAFATTVLSAEAIATAVDLTMRQFYFHSM